MDTANNATISPKKFLLAVLGILAITATIIGYIIYSGSKEDTPKQVTFSIDETTQQTLEQKAATFINKAGTFGADYSDLNGNTAYNISRILKLGSSDSSSFFTPRSVPYNTLYYQDSMIAQGSPISYPQSSVEGWEVPYELENMIKYEVKNVTATAPTEGYITQDGTERKLVQVQTYMDTTVSKVVQTATDSSWDGTYDRMKKQFNQTPVTVTFVEQEGQWLAFDIQTDKPFLLAIWNNPTYDDMAESMFGFTTVETYTPTISPQEAFGIKQ